MKGDKQVVVNFNRLITREFTAANQYFLNSRIFNNWGLVRLGDIEYQEYMDEMNHVDCYIQRVLFLEGTIFGDVQKYNLCNKANNVEEILQINLNLENLVVNDLRECIAYADTVQDFVSRDIMINILVKEEQHTNFLETEISLITRIGICNYLQYQLQHRREKI